MAIELNDNIYAKVNRPTDFRFGPFETIDEANLTIPISQRYHGLTFGVYSQPYDIPNSDIVFYYYWNSLSDTDIKPLTEDKWSYIDSSNFGIYRASPVVIGNSGFSDSRATLEIDGRVSQVGLRSSTFFGFESGFNHSTSTIGANSAFGHAALKNITTAHSNSAFGWISGSSLQSGIDNSFFGRQSASALTNGSYNTVVGAASLATATSASNVTTLGYAALLSHPNPVNQVAIGTQALLLDNQGSENTAIGSRVAENLRNATTNSQNVIIGYFAAQANLTMQNSIIIGRNARPAGNGQINQVVIGHDAVGLGSNTSAVGNASTVFGRWWGNLLLGTSTNSGDRLRVDGTVRLDTVTSATGDVVTIDANNVLRRQTVAQIGAQVPALSAVPISYTSENTMVTASSQSSQIANQLYFDGYSFYRYKGSGTGSIINYDLVGKLKPRWTLVPNDGITTFFTSMCYGNGNFVAVSTNSGSTANKIAVSPDGFNWKYYSSAVTSIHQQIAYGNGIFVATIFFNVAQNAQRIVTSFDGVNWVGRSTSADSLSLGPIVFADGKFVALTNNGTAYSFVSTDGINWTQSSPITTTITNFTYITYGNGIFVACGQASFAPTESPFMTSTDGLNWTMGTAYLGGTFNSIAYGNGIFVAVRNSSGNLFVRSTDGINWTAITLPGGIQNGFGSIVYGDGKFIAVSIFDENASGSFTNTLFSEDGITWQTMYGGAKTGYSSICYGNGLFIGIAPSPNKFRVYGNIIRKFNENQEIFEILRKVPNYNPSVAQVLSHSASNSFTWTNI